MRKPIKVVKTDNQANMFTMFQTFATSQILKKEILDRKVDQKIQRTTVVGN